MKLFKTILLIAIFFTVTANTWAQKEKEVKLNIKNGQLYGTLLTPSQKTGTIAIIIPGSGPTDRNGNSFLVRPNSYKLIADELAENGIASLRYDKAGIGKSTTSLEEKEMRFENNVEQVTAWIDYLTKKKFDNIILIGQSEGSLIGMLAAQERKVAKFISLTGPGRAIDVILTEQITEQAPNQVEASKEILAQLKSGKMVSDVPAELIAIFRKSIQPYMISWIQYDPKVEIGKLTIPTLIINGSTDIQVALVDGEQQKEGNPKAEYVVIEGMNHVLKEAPANRDENVKTYYDSKLPLHAELMKVILKFVKE